MKLTGKLFIKGYIVTETGLHIGGSKSSLDIGGVDLNVIKTPKGVPFIPGSSLKGKLRSLLAKLHGSVAVSSREGGTDVITDENFSYLLSLFGSSGDDRASKSEELTKVTRLLVRDAKLDETHFKTLFDEELELGYTDIKWENRIDRKTGTAKDPRQLERVPVGARFEFELVYDLYDDTTEPNKASYPSYFSSQSTLLDLHLSAIKTAMQLLQDDYLGGQGSRGYGKIRFEDVRLEQKNITDEGYVIKELDEKIKAHNIVETFNSENQTA
jgi:CRISPR-associated protein Csm3